MTFAMKQSLVAAAVGLGCLGVVMECRSANGAVLTYSLSNINFTDGTTIVGSFGFDPSQGNGGQAGSVNFTVANPNPANGVQGFPFGTINESSDVGIVGTNTFIQVNYFASSIPYLIFLAFNPELSTGSSVVIGFYGFGGNRVGLEMSGAGSVAPSFTDPDPVPVPAPPGVLGLLLPGALAAHKARKSQRAAALAQKTPV